MSRYTPHAADYTDEAGAEALRASIRRYWRLRGYTVRIHLKYMGVVSNDPKDKFIRNKRYDVRSDLVNGLPVGYLR